MTSTTTVSVKKVPPNSDLTVYVDGKIINRFKSFGISHALDIVPMSFNLEYGFEDGDTENPLSLSSLIASSSQAASGTNTQGTLTIGKKIEIYLEKQHVFTGYIDNSTEALSHGQHSLFIDGRSVTSVLVDATTDKPSGALPSAVVTIKDVADYMFSGFGITTKDKTAGETKWPMANLLQVTLETKPYEYVSTMAQFEGKLLYDNELGQMIIDNVATKAAIKGTITNANSPFEAIAVHRSTLGRYRNYTCVINAFGGFAGVDNILTANPASQDYAASELPPGKNLTFVSQSAYPTGDASGYFALQKDLVQYMANMNWGRGYTVTGTATGFLNPITKKLWRVNTYVDFKMDKPSLTGGFVVQAVNFYIDEYGGRKTDLVLVPPESLQVEPISITPLIPMASDSNNSEDDSNSGTTEVQKPQNVQLPEYAKKN